MLKVSLNSFDLLEIERTLILAKRPTVAIILILMNRQIVKTSGFSVVLHQAGENNFIPWENKIFCSSESWNPSWFVEPKFFLILLENSREHNKFLHKVKIRSEFIVWSNPNGGYKWRGREESNWKVGMRGSKIIYKYGGVSRNSGFLYKW